MAKKRAGGLIGTLIVAGIAAGIVKYLKDYSNASFTDEEEIRRVKKNSGEMKEAAKRTYIAIKEKGNVKEAAEELAKAAGSVVTDSAHIAKTAGAGAVQAAKEIKAKYDEDPESAKEEVISNLKEMGSEISQKVSETAEEVVERFKGEGEFTDFEEGDFEDVPKAAPEEEGEAADKCQAAEAAETAEAAEAMADEIIAETFTEDPAEEEAIETAQMLDAMENAAADEALEEAAEAAQVLGEQPTATITDDEID